MSYISQQTTEFLPLAESCVLTQSARLSHIPGDAAEYDIADPHASFIQSPCRTVSVRQGHQTPTRVTKSNYRRDQTVPRPQSRPRVAFHNCITSFFGNVQHDCSPESETSQLLSRTSNFGSERRSSLHGSVPSIDFKSPAAFVFSGPNLDSTSSMDDTTYLPTPTSTATEPKPLSRERTNSFSMLDKSDMMEVELLEPIVQVDIVRTMSDVLLGTGMPSDRSTTAPKDHTNSDSHSDLHDHPGGETNTIRQNRTDSAAYMLEVLLLLHLDLAT
jgi:hypothetical protein